MPRGRRLKPVNERTLYHVFTRTSRQAFLWDRDFTKEWLYKYIIRLSTIFYVEIHALTILDNHYHIALTVLKPNPSEADVVARFDAFQATRSSPRKWYPWLYNEWARRLTDLSAFMQEINRSSACYLNALDDKKGHVWGSRFGSVLIEDGATLLKTMAYVELNPVRAGIVEQPSDYRFCSVGRKVHGGAQAAGITFPKLAPLAFLKKRSQQHEAFCHFVDVLAQKEHGKDAEFPVVQKELKAFISSHSPDLKELVYKRASFMVQSAVLGSESFCARHIKQFKLQRSLFGDVKPFPLSGGLYNTRLRAGPGG